jgi:hypothetical protein
MTHALKCWPEYYAPIEKGDKLFELRKDDRPFKTGDTVILQEYDNKLKEYTGNECQFAICFVLRDVPASFGLKPGFCVLGLKKEEHI